MLEITSIFKKTLESVLKKNLDKHSQKIFQNVFILKIFLEKFSVSVL